MPERSEATGSIDEDPAGASSLPVHALDALPDAVVVVDDARVVRYANRRALALLEATREEVIGHTCADVLGCEDPTGRCRVHEQLVTAPQDHVERCSWGGLTRTATLVRDGDGRPAGVALVLHREQAERLSDPGQDFSLRDLVGRSPAIRKIADTVRRLANTDVPVLITGESGTGKELVARALHGSSRRKDKSFIAVNCGGIPLDLAESELFGHVRGAFTGAVRDRKGAVELAQEGTFFLDEVGDLPTVLQPKLLRLLQERTYQRVGDVQTRTANIRLVAATNVELDRAVEAGAFRRDLYYRLRVVPIHMPPLRDRPEDIVPLASILLARRSVAAGRLPMRFSPPAVQMLERHSWPGNVRELINVLDYLVALCPSDIVEPDQLPQDLTASSGAANAVRRRYVAAADRDDEAGRILRALHANDWHRQRTADALGMDRVTLYRKMREHGLEEPGRPR